MWWYAQLIVVFVGIILVVVFLVRDEIKMKKKEREAFGGLAVERALGRLLVDLLLWADANPSSGLAHPVIDEMIRRCIGKIKKIGEEYPETDVEKIISNLALLFQKNRH